MIHAEKHGIPQKRHRVIIIGVRNDIDAVPERLYNGNAAITVRNAIDDLPKIRSGLSKEHDSYAAWSGVLEEFVKDMGGIESVPEDVSREIEVSCTGRDNLTLGGEFISSDQGEETSEWLREHDWWFYDARLKGYCNHSARSHIRQDLLRYLYASCYAKVTKTSPRIVDFPYQLWPAHRNVDEAA